MNRKSCWFNNAVSIVAWIHICIFIPPPGGVWSLEATDWKHEQPGMLLHHDSVRRTHQVV